MSMIGETKSGAYICLYSHGEMIWSLESGSLAFRFVHNVIPTYSLTPSILVVVLFVFGNHNWYILFSICLDGT